MKFSKRFIILIIVVIVTLFTFGWYATQPKGKIEFALAPQEITATLNDKERSVKHGQTIKLTPGKYTASFTRNGFKTDTQTIIVEKNKTKRIVIALTPLTDAAKKILNDNPESKKIVEEYKQVRRAQLIASLPLSGVNYSIKSCQSVKQPKIDVKAVCIVTSTPEGEQMAKKYLEQMNYNLEELEILTGTENIKAVIATDTYKIDYYTNVHLEGSNKLTLFITPINVPFVAYTTQYDSRLEDIKSAALNDLKVQGYDVDKYDIYYSNSYLSKYNPNADIPDEHAIPPIF